MFSFLTRRGVIVTAALATVLIAAMATAVAAVIEPDPGPFTGCLATKSSKAAATVKGVLYNVAKGNIPLAPCLPNDPVVQFSNAEGPQGEQGEQGERGPAGASYPTTIRWNFDFPACSSSCDRFASETIFIKGTKLTPLSGEITTLTGVPDGCVDTLFDVNFSTLSGYLFADSFNPSTVSLPLALSPNNAATASADVPLNAYFLACMGSNAGVIGGTPGASGYLTFAVEYPASVIP